MHETVLASSLLKIVEEAVEKNSAPGQQLRVTEIALETGLLACLEPQTLRGCFEIMAEGTVAEKATLSISTRPMCGVCPYCEAEVQTMRREFYCPQCSGRNVDWQGGHEMEIVSIQVAECGSENGDVYTEIP